MHCTENKKTDIDKDREIEILIIAVGLCSSSVLSHLSVMVCVAAGQQGHVDLQSFPVMPMCVSPSMCVLAMIQLFPFLVTVTPPPPTHTHTHTHT